MLSIAVREWWDFSFSRPIAAARMKYNEDWCKFEIFLRVHDLLLTRDLGEGWDFFFFQTDYDISVLDVRD